MKLPNFNLNFLKLFQRKNVDVKQISFYRVWKRFISQTPREFRSLIKQHQHFIVLGEEKSGKTELIHGIVEQSQNIYPFEVEYTKDPNIQLYLGPKQLIQELSVAIIKDRTIAARKNLIQLWKKLCSKNTPIVVIAYHCWSALSKESKDINKSARMIAGKLLLLSEIVKKPLKVRIALTHLDKIEGYMEFADFIKQHNITVEIPIDSNFESMALEHALNVFKEKCISLILTTVPANDFQKILHFFEELPKFFIGVEEYLRALTTGNAPGQIELEKLTFTTKIEPYTAFPSFDWKAPESNSIFFRHPMLKHQIASAAVFVLCASLVLNNFLKDRLQVKLTGKGVNSLVYLQPKVFAEEVIPKIEDMIKHRPKKGYLPILPRFYSNQLRETNQNLSMRIRKHILEPSLRKIMLQDDQEVKVLYMLGLIYATPENPLGSHILKNIQDWSAALNLDDKLIRSYIFSNLDNIHNRIEIEHLDKINVITPLSSPAPWLNFLNQFQDLVNQPVFTGHNFEGIRSEAAHLLREYRRVKDDAHGFVICNLLKEVNPRLLSDFARNIQILGWLEQNSDYVESFLVFVCQTCPDIPDISEHNVSQFFAKVKDVASINEKEYKPYNLLLEGYKFSFPATKWVNLSVAHVIERLIQNYIVLNNDTQGDIFFKNTPIIPDLVVESYRNEFPHFDEPVVIKGRYTRLAFEKNVRYTAESLLKLLSTLPLNEEDKERFTRFLQQEVVSYAKQYQLEYERLYAACNIKTANLEEVKAILQKLVEPSSSFQHFLNLVNHHTEVFSNPPACLSALQEMNHFDFLRVLMSQVKNKSTPFEKYQTIIKQATAQLSQHGELKDYTNVVNFEDMLVPAAQISLSILRNDADSLLNQITKNLSEIGVPALYHHLFTAPIMQVYYLGVKDLKHSIDKVWEGALQPQIRDLLSKRPFNQESPLASTFEEVRKITNPTCEIWTVIKQIIQPVSVSTDGIWSPKPACILHLSDSLYASVNRLAKISRVLWDNEGNPQTIKLNVQSLPFESNGKIYPAPILSYLVTGDETFHNFNQSPSWHPIQIEWWKNNNSTVVLELSNKNKTRSYRDIKVLSTAWSFFELLRKAAFQENNVWQWDLGGPVNEKTSHVALKFEKNPWSLFEGYEEKLQGKL